MPVTRLDRDRAVNTGSEQGMHKPCPGDQHLEGGRELEHLGLAVLKVVRHFRNGGLNG